MKEHDLFNNISRYVIAFFSFLIVAFLCVLSFFNTSVIVQDYTEVTLFVRDEPLRNLFILLIFILLLCILSVLPFIGRIRKRINENRKLFITLEIILLLIVAGLGLFWVLSARFYPTADQYSVQLAAAQMREGNFESAFKNAYLARNPQQAGLVVLSYLLSFVIGKENYIVLEIINVLLVCVIYKELSDIGKELGCDESERLLILVTAVFFPVPLFYSYFIYGLIPGLATALLAIKHEMRFFREEKKKDLVLTGVFLSLSLFIRTNNLIIFIAMIIYALIRITEKKRSKDLIIIPLFVLTLLFQSFIPVRIIEGMSGQKLREGMSSLSYIAMGLQEGERAEGWYNGYNNDSYELAGMSPERQKEMALENISERLELFAEDGDYAFKFFMKKTASQWNNPTFQVFWNLETKMWEKDKNAPIKERPSYVMNLVEKKGAYDVQKYLNIIHSLILSGALLWLLYKKAGDRKTDDFLLLLVFVGGFLFHLMWEAKAQYTFVYFVLLLPYAVMAFYRLPKTINQFRNGIGFSVVAAIKVVAVILLIVMFVSGTTSFLDTDNMRCYSYINDIEYME